MRNGPGTMILPDGTVYTGFFRDDELVDTEATLAASRAKASGVQAGAEMDDATVAALGDTPMPAESDSLVRKASDPVDENDLLPDQDKPSTAFVEPEVAARDPEPVVETAGADAIEPEPDPAPYAGGNPFTADVTEINESIKAELIETIDLWAAAWSDQNVTQYLANYADDFMVPGKQSRRNWEALRKTRVQRPRFIKVAIEYQGFELVDTNVAEVFFRQSYQSNTYSDLTDKVLRLRRENNHWKILTERSR